MKVALDANILVYLLEDIEPYASRVEALLGSFTETSARKPTPF